MQDEMPNSSDADRDDPELRDPMGVDSDPLSGRVRLLYHSRRRRPMSVDPRSKPTAIRTDLGAIFVSMELSRSLWLITSLSPGAGERMSKHSVRGGDVAGLLMRFAQL